MSDKRSPHCVTEGPHGPHWAPEGMQNGMTVADLCHGVTYDCSALHPSNLDMFCIKPLYLAKNGEIWPHAGGHFFTTAEGQRRLKSGEYNAEKVLRELQRVPKREELA